MPEDLCITVSNFATIQEAIDHLDEGLCRFNVEGVLRATVLGSVEQTLGIHRSTLNEWQSFADAIRSIIRQTKEMDTGTKATAHGILVRRLREHQDAYYQKKHHRDLHDLLIFVNQREQAILDRQINESGFEVTRSEARSRPRSICMLMPPWHRFQVSQ